MKVEDLQVAKVEPIPSVSDRNPDVECEFFHTRQVCHCSICVVACLLVIPTKHFFVATLVVCSCPLS